MLGHLGLVDGAGVVVEAARDGEVNGEILLGDAEVLEVLRHHDQLVKPLVEGRVHAAVHLQAFENLRVRAADGHEVQHVLALVGEHLHLVDEKLLDLLRADLIELVHRAHDLPRLLAHAVHGVEAVQELAVVDADPELFQPQAREGLVDDGGDLRLIENIELAIADHVDIRLVELAEAPALGALPPVDLADLIAAEGEAQLPIVPGDVLRERHREVKAQGKIALALLEAVDLLLGLAAALGEQHLRRFDDRRVERREAVERVGIAQNAHHLLQLHLLLRRKLHEARERARGYFSHSLSPHKYNTWRGIACRAEDA